METFRRIIGGFAGIVLCASVVLAQATPAGKRQPKPVGQSKDAGKTADGTGMPMVSKPSPEIQKVIKMFGGMWSTSEKIEASEFMPQGGTGSGTDSMKAGPGGNSLVNDYRSRGSMGSFAGHGIIFWDAKRQAFSSVWCDSMSPNGCESGMSGKWEGDDLVFNSETEMMGKKVQSKQVYTDIKPASFTFYIDSSTDGGPIKRAMTIKYTKKSANSGAGAARP
ncbi:MAG TPA: DUF1579 family protein [Candidatus Dormibacteraeota bacterium]|nr:DUF1579 family protein [Candidatus Dormibacteraeota bacterium]